MNDTTDGDLTAELEKLENWEVPAGPALEPLPPLIPEAHWTSTQLAVPLIASSQAFYADWTALQGEAPYAIYHYTDAAGLSAILEGGRIWASDLLYLAGSRETDYVCDMVREQIRRRWNRADALVNEFCEKAQAALDPSQWQRSIFAACFCENGDALGQWRAYAGPRGGYGADGVAWWLSATAMQSEGRVSAGHRGRRSQDDTVLPRNKSSGNRRRPSHP